MSKMSRRILAMLLAFVMMASMSISALAVDTDDMPDAGSPVSDLIDPPATPPEDIPTDSTPDTPTTPATPDVSDDVPAADDTGSNTDIMPLADPDYTIEVGESIDISGDDGKPHYWSIRSGSDKIQIVSGSNKKTVTVRGLAVGSATLVHAYRWGRETITIQVVAASNTVNGYFFLHKTLYEAGDSITDDQFTGSDDWNYLGIGKLDTTVTPILDKGSNKSYFVSGNEKTERYVKTLPSGTYPTVGNLTYDPDGNTPNTYRIAWQRIGVRTSYDDITNKIDKQTAEREGRIWHVDGLPIRNDTIMVQFIVEEPDGNSSTKQQTFYKKGTAESVIGAKQPQVDETKNINGVTWKFDGWYLDDGDETNGVYNTPANFNGGPQNENVTYYGRYVKVGKNLVYKYCGTNGNVQSKSYTIYNTNRQIPLPKAPDGCWDNGKKTYFAGWNNQEYGYSVVNNTTVDDKNTSASSYAHWVADTEGGNTMTIYAVYYQDASSAPQYVVTTDTGFTNFSGTPESGWVNADLFGQVQIEKLNTTARNEYFVYAQFKIDEGSSSDNGQDVDGYDQVGFVVSTSNSAIASMEIATAPTIQGGYQRTDDNGTHNSTIYANSVKVNGVSHPLPADGDHAHYIAWIISFTSVADITDFYVTPFAIDETGAYIYGNPGTSTK